MLKKILLLGTILFFSFILHAQEKGVQFMDNTPWENVIQKAKEQNKWIFVDCYTSWCGPCKMLATDVFTRDDVGLCQKIPQPNNGIPHDANDYTR